MKQRLPISVENFFNSNHFADWLRNQPDDRTFNYMDITECVLASYGKETFVVHERFSVGGATVRIVKNGPRVSFSVGGEVGRLAEMLAEFPAEIILARDVKTLWGFIDHSKITG